MKEKVKGLGKKFRKLRKKKAFWIILILLILVMIGVIVFFVVKSKASDKDTTVTIQEVKAATGDVSNTIESTGTVSNGSSVDIEVPVGVKIGEVLVAAGDSVTAGENLASVNAASVATVLLTVRENLESVEDAIDDLSSDADDSSTDEYLEKIVLENTQTELEEQKTLLETMLSSGYIVATGDGIVDTVSVSDHTEVSATSNSASSSSNSADSSTGSGGVTGMSTSNTDGFTVSLLSTDVSDGEITTASAESEVSTQEGTVIDITKSDLSGLTITAPVTGEKPQEQLASSDKYTAAISWDCNGVYQASTSYTATVTLTAASGYTFQDGDQYGITIKGATLSSDSPKVYEKAGAEGNQLIIKAKFEKTAAESGNNGSSSSGSNTSGSTGASASESGLASGNASGSGSSSGSGSASGNSSSVTADTTATNSQYTVENGTPFTIASGDDVVISVDVDELDINSVVNGQSATVTLDALENQEFEGTVTSISSTATTSNGSSTYPVEITLGKEEGMKVGMSASTTIRIEEVTDVVTIPVNALQERQGSSFVYTEKDSEGNLSGEVEVETGLSDGSTVEITSGLSEGDTVYYQKAENDSSENSMMMGGGMGGMSGQDRGEMKQNMGNGGGDTPPSGGAPSGN